MSTGPWLTNEQQYEKCQKQIHKLEGHMKNLVRNKDALTRNERTHQLCTIGGMVYKHFDVFSYLPDEAINDLLFHIAKLPEVEKMIAEKLDHYTSL